MKYCQHYIKGSKQCSLGIVPVNCRSCSMFQVASRRMFMQPTINQNSSAVSLSSVDVVSSSSASVLSSEQKILQSSAVKGGCGCRKG